MCEQGYKDETTRDCGNAPASHVDESPPLSAEQYRNHIKNIIEEIEDTKELKRIYKLASYLYIK